MDGNDKENEGKSRPKMLLNDHIVPPKFMKFQLCPPRIIQRDYTKNISCAKKLNYPS